MDCIQNNKIEYINNTEQIDGINVNQIWLADDIIFIIVAETEDDIVEIKFDAQKFRLTPDRNCVVNIKNTKIEERIRYITFRITNIKTHYKDLNFELTLKKNNNVVSKKFAIVFSFLWFFPKIKEIK